MAAFFLDTSALVKRYATETGTAWVKALIDPAVGNRIYVARITEVETVAALARKLRGNHITSSDATTAISPLEDEIKGRVPYRRSQHRHFRRRQSFSPSPLPARLGRSTSRRRFGSAGDTRGVRLRPAHAYHRR